MQEPLEEFLAEERAKKLSDGTIRKRRMVMEWLDEWTDKDIREWERGDIRDFLIYLRDERGACDGTVSSYMGQVTRLFEYLQEENLIEENPRENIKYNDYLNLKSTETEKVMRERKSYVALSQEEAEKLLANATAPKLRNTVMMKLQLETGPRVGELVNVRLEEDLDLESRTVKYKTLKKKDETEYRTLEFSRGVKILLNQWLNEGYRDRFKSANNSPYLFVSRNSKRMTEQAYNEAVKKSATEAGIQEETRIDSSGHQEWKVRSHVLRHTYAENMVRNGCDISRLADLMGHESIETTRKYLDHDKETLREAQREFAPSFSAGG